MKIVSMILLLVIIPITAIGQNLKALDDKYGFRDAKFGMSPISFKNLELRKMSPLKGLDGTISKVTPANSIQIVKRYWDRDVDLHIGNFDLDYVAYDFYKNKLVSIEIGVSQGGPNLDGVLEVLEIAYGKGIYIKTTLDDETYNWNGEKVEMNFYKSEKTQHINYIEIISKELKKWEDKDLEIIYRQAEQKRKQDILDAAKKL